MKRIILSISILLMGVWLSGCATLSKDECRTANWRTIGYEDGSRGYSSQRISEHREACAEYGIAPDFDSYLAGHNEGIRLYCVPHRGFQLGRRGANYSGICPSDLEPQFLTNYRQGQKVYRVEQQIRDIQQEQNQLRDEQDELQHEIEENEKLIVSDNTSPRVRAELLEQNKKLEDIIEEKEAIIYELDLRIRQLERKVEKLLRERSF